MAMSKLQNLKKSVFFPITMVLLLIFLISEDMSYYMFSCLLLAILSYAVKLFIYVELT